MIARQADADKVQVRKEGGKRRAVAFTILAGLFALVGLVFLEGLTEGLMPWVIVGCPGCTPGITSTPEIYRWHGAEHGATVGILLSGSLLALLWQARAKPLLLQFYALGHLILILGYGLFAPPLPIAKEVRVVGMMVLAVALLIAVYPEPRAVLRFSIVRPINRPLFVLSLAAALALAPYAVQNLQWQFQGVGGEQAMTGRWAGAAILAVCLVLAGLFAATLRPGWRELGVLAGIAYLYLGAAALTVPDQPGSWGVLGGVLALVGGVAYLAVTTREARRVSSPSSLGGL